MADGSLGALLVLAVSTGLLHTVAGPDHYVPFVALAKARDWSWRRTALITGLCGVGHVLGSVVLGILGIAVGMAISHMEAVETTRGQIAAWLMIGFGLVYAAWGLRRAWRRRPHSHSHLHMDGSRHTHGHVHEHAHVHLHERPGARHDAAAGTELPRSVTPWVLFIVFVFGPCEVLIPQVMVPAARSDWWGVTAIVTVFGITTIGTMLCLVLSLSFGLRPIRLAFIERYTHALAGLTVALCGGLVLAGL